MRHGDKINNLSRTTAHRKALLSNLANALLVNKRIVTTLAKAKALRVYIEPLITKTKKNDGKEQISHNHRLVFSQLQNKEAVKELFTVIAPKVAGRPGGYTRIIKLGKRVGDNAETALIELVDFNEIYGKGTEKAAAATSKRTRRAGGGGKKKAEAKEEAAPETPAVAEAAPEAEPEQKAE
jgi:large subunit ribosomal protein L17